MNRDSRGVEVPIQPVDKPIICNPYDEPNDHWVYDNFGNASRAGHRRPAGYWYKTEKTGSRQERLFFEEQRDDLPLVNLLRDDVRRWREVDYRGASNVTRELLQWWARKDRGRRLFFCQREAVETIIYLAELRMPGKSSRTRFKTNFSLTDEDLQRLLHGERPSFAREGAKYEERLIDRPVDESLLPLVRLGCKMATGSGKTVVMAMLIAWAFCNRGKNPMSREFPSAVLVVCPNVTIRERLQVLRPERPDNYYDAFDLMPVKYRPHLQMGKVLVTNWHAFAPESEKKEGDRNWAVVDKGPETDDVFAERVLKHLANRMPIMVLNDEGHHCWRPAADVETDNESTGEETKAIEGEKEEARIWLTGLDRINNSTSDGRPGIGFCVDLSATPFYIGGSGYPEGWPFPWLISDFGLVDAIECGIVKIPRLPVQDTTGRPEPKYFALWKWIREHAEPGDLLPGRAQRPKPDVIWRECQAALQQLADQWIERFQYLKDAKPGQEHIPPVLIIVCDNTDIAEFFYRKISGEREEEIVTAEDIEAAIEEDEVDDPPPDRKSGRAKKPKTRTVYEPGAIYPEYFSNTATMRRTLRIDSKLLAEAESDDPQKTRSQAAEALRRIVATVGKRDEPGEHIRCVVSVAMLTEGWDANNVTHILGIRAFGSQLLCEQVVGRGLRRIDYDPDPKTGMLTEEYVDVYGIPFSVIPYKGRPGKQKAPEDRPKNHVRALEDRAGMEIRFPVVEGCSFALRRNLIRCDVAGLPELRIDPSDEPTATFLLPTVGYREGYPSRGTANIPFDVQDREAYYQHTHVQAIEFAIARLIVERLTSHSGNGSDAKRRVMRLQSRHQLFPQVYRFVNEYVRTRVDFQDCHPCELGLEKYVTRLTERISGAIEPADAEGEPPLMPVLNRYKPIGSTRDVDFKTTKPVWSTNISHINQVVADTATWEQGAAFRLEQLRDRAVKFYAKNDHLSFVIPYEYQGVQHSYEPDFLVRLRNDVTLILEIKGLETEQDRAKHAAARHWVSAVNNWAQLGQWDFRVCRNPQELGRTLGQSCSTAEVG